MPYERHRQERSAGAALSAANALHISEEYDRAALIEKKSVFSPFYSIIVLVFSS